MLEALFGRWPLKLLALCLAFAVWAAVTSEGRILQDHRVPVDLALPDDLILQGSSPSTVTVRLRGPEGILKRIDPYGLEVRVDLKDATPGQRNVQFGPDNVEGVPGGVEVERIDPDRVRLVLERRARRKVPVVPSVVGKPVRGYSFYGARVVPDSLEVEGPQSKLEGLARLRTDPIHLEGKSATFSLKVAAVPDSPEIRVLDARPLEVRVAIDSSPVQKRFPFIPIVLSGQAGHASSPVTSLAVTVSGPPSVVNQLQASQLRAVVDLAGLGPRREPYTVPIRFELLDLSPEDLGRLRVYSAERDTLQVHIAERGTRR